MKKIYKNFEKKKIKLLKKFSEDFENNWQKFSEIIDRILKKISEDFEKLSKNFEKNKQKS